jgi:hypothetical protein
MDKKISTEKVRCIGSFLVIPLILSKIQAAATARIRPVIKSENPRTRLWEKWRPTSPRLPGHLWKASVKRDEEPKLRVGQRECSYMVTGSEFGGSRVPQILGTGQGKEGHPIMLELAPGER